MKYLSKVVKNDRSRRRSGGGGRENGFSLIELMIAASILIVVVLFAVKMFNFYMSGSRLRTEKNQIDREKDSLGILLRPDFENAGFNLISRQNHVYGTQPAAFASDTRYQAIGNGEIVRLAPGGAR